MKEQSNKKPVDIDRDTSQICLALLKRHKKLLLFDVFFVVTVLILGVGIPTLIFSISIYQQRQSSSEPLIFAFLEELPHITSFLSEITVGTSLLAVLYLFFLYGAWIFFSSALTLCIYDALQNKTVSVRKGMAAALTNIWNLFLWTLLSVLVSVVARSLQRKDNADNATTGVTFVPPLFPAIGRLGWKLATYFVVPVIMIKKISVFRAIVESATTFKKTWGENVYAHIKVSITFLPYSGLILALIFVGVYTRSLWIMLSFSIIGLIAVSAIILIKMTLYSILRVILFFYADTGKTAENFSEEFLKTAFVSRRE